MNGYLLFLTAWCCIGTTLGAEEAEKLDTERVLALVEKLNHEDFQVRDDAFHALKDLGPVIWPMLEKFTKDGDAERAARIRKLARDWCIFTKEQKKQAEGFCARLYSEDLDTRAEAADGLIALGPAGVKLLEEKLSSAPAVPEAKAELSAQVFHAGDRVNAKITLANTGQNALWYAGNYKYLADYDLAEPFGEPRPKGPLPGSGKFGPCRSGGRKFLVKDGQNPIILWTPLAGGKSREFNGESFAPSGSPGRYKAIYKADLNGGAIFPRLNPASDLGEAVEIAIGKGLPKEQITSVAEAFFYFLPDLSKEPEDAFLRMEVAAEARDIAAKSKLEARVIIKALGKDATVALEEGFARYAWYALLDAKGVPVRYGSLRSVLAGDEAEALAARRLKKGEQSEFKIAVPAPEKPGKYSLAAGYKAWNTSEEHFLEAPKFGDADGKDTDLVLYKNGELWCKTGNLDVKAQAAPEAQK